MKLRVLPLALGVIALALTAMIVETSFQRSRDPLDYQNLIMHTPEHQQITLTTTWESEKCGTVVVITTFRSAGHETETHAEFVARHLAAVAAMMIECPEI